MNSLNGKVTVVGAGLAGSLLAVSLAKRGLSVEVYEKRPDMRKEEISAGRSINLNLSTRGIYALEEIGVADRIMKEVIPMKGRLIHSISGQLNYSAYGKDSTEVGHSVSRGGLNIALLNAAEEFENVTLKFSHSCLGMNFQTGELEFFDEANGQKVITRCDTVFATDGAGSPIRESIAKFGNFECSIDMIEHGYKELTIPPSASNGFRIEKEVLHIWPRGDYMLIALPNLDGSFTCTLFLAHKGTPSFEKLGTPEEVDRFFKEQFCDAHALMPTLTEDFFANPTGNLGTVKCYPWSVGGQALLLGDSAHAIVPFYGQGMNCAFEDCTVLNACIDKFGDDWQSVFHHYQAIRKADTDAIADLAMDNFVEMRDSVANPKFLLKRELEHRLEEHFPDKFISKYAMVTFHRLPYSTAMKKGRIQDEVLMRICSDIHSLDGLNLSEVLSQVEQATTVI